MMTTVEEKQEAFEKYVEDDYDRLSKAYIEYNDTDFRAFCWQEFEDKDN